MEAVQSAISGNNDYFMQKQFEIMIEMNNKKFASDINALKEMVNSLHEEIADIRRNINKSTVIQKVEASAVSAESRQQSNENAQKNSMPTRPRYGDYKSEDVSINKFFYFGNKKVR